MPLREPRSATCGAKGRVGWGTWVGLRDQGPAVSHVPAPFICVACGRFSANTPVLAAPQRAGLTTCNPPSLPTCQDPVSTSNAQEPPLRTFQHLSTELQVPQK